MATAELEPKPAQELVTFSIQPITYEVTRAEVEKVASAAMMLRVHDIDDKAGLEQCTKEQTKLSRMTSTIEKQRVAMKRDSLEYGRQVDATAKELAGPLEKAKAHLQEQRDIVKREEDRKKREAEERRQSKISERQRLLLECGKAYTVVEIAELSDDDFAALLESEQADKKKRDDEAAAAKAEQERIAAEQKAEAERLAAEQTRLKRMSARITVLAREGFEHPHSDDQLADMSPEDWDALIETARAKKAERDQAAAEERARLDKQREEQAAAQAKIDAEKQRIADEARKAKLVLMANRMKALNEIRIYFENPEFLGDLPEEEWQRELANATEQAKKRDDEYAARVAAEAKEQAEAAEAELARLESLKPDSEKLQTVVAALYTIVVPDVSEAAAGARQQVVDAIRYCARDVRGVCDDLVASK